MTLETITDVPQARAREDTRTQSVAQPQTAPVLPAPPGLVSVLVPCCGQLEYTRLCVPSLLRDTPPPYELIFVDIASLDGTAEYLAGLAAAASVRVEVVRTITDLGIPEACQEALARARGEFLVLVNNDTVVTDRWLNQMAALARLSPHIGLVGPMSNYASPPQLVETVPYRVGAKVGARSSGNGLVRDCPVDVTAVDRFARQHRDQHQGKWMEVEHLGGFCLFINREVLTRIGPLQAQSGLEVFDTDLLCQKARQAGYKLACCRDLFIHHFGSRTFAHGGPASEL